MTVGVDSKESKEGGVSSKGGRKQVMAVGSAMKVEVALYLLQAAP